MPKMLILRGNSGANYPDESGKPHKYERGALHEVAVAPEPFEILFWFSVNGKSGVAR